MLNITGQVFSEVYDIIYNMKIYNQIPKEFVQLIDDNRDKQYKVNIDYSKNINEQELQRGTRVILSLIYRDYLCSREEKQVLINKDKEEIKKYEEALREKYNPDNIFKKSKENIDVENNTNTALIERKESIFTKIKKFIFRILHIKH